MYEFTTVGWLKHVIFHPVEGFEDLRWKKQGSIKLSLIIVCALFNGEGTLKKICIYSAYALVPYIFCTYIAVLFSNFLVQDEAIWVMFIQYVGLGWSLILMIQAMRAVHQYTFGKTLLSMVMTIVAMLLILFLAILLLSLFQQVYVFIYSIYTEVAYRIRG